MEPHTKAFSKVGVEHYFKVVDEDSTTFKSKHTFRIRANVPARFFYRQYFWTGVDVHETPKPRILSEKDKWGHPLHRIHGPVICENQSRIVLVDLGRTMNVGQEDTVRFEHQFFDLESKFEPFFGQQVSSITEPPERIAITVDLPRRLARNVHFTEVYPDTRSEASSENLKPRILPDGRHEFTKVISGDSVQPNRYYYIKWSKAS